MQAFYLSRRYKKQIRSDWLSINTKVMREVLDLKFGKILLCRMCLLLTGDKYLVEHNPVRNRDVFWSDNFDGTGENMLGKILMDIRYDISHCGRVGPTQKYRDWLLTPDAKKR